MIYCACRKSNIIQRIDAGSLRNAIFGVAGCRVSEHVEVKLKYGGTLAMAAADAFSGKFNVRIPKALHCQLSEKAERERRVALSI